MKKSKGYLILLLAGSVTFTTGLWLFSTMDKIGPFEWTVAALVGIVVIYGVFKGVRQLKDEKQGVPLEDEMSKMIKEKAAAKAFSLSFYLWMFIAMFLVDTEIRVEIPIGLGILGMGIIFIVYWIYYSKEGLPDENKD